MTIHRPSLTKHIHPDPRPSSCRSVMRYYRVGPSLVNYGGIPQTWEASDEPDPLTGRPADNDPVDFLEVGLTPGLHFVSVI